MFRAKNPKGWKRGTQYLSSFYFQFFPLCLGVSVVEIYKMDEDEERLPGRFLTAQNPRFGFGRIICYSNIITLNGPETIESRSYFRASRIIAYEGFTFESSRQNRPACIALDHPVLLLNPLPDLLFRT